MQNSYTLYLGWRTFPHDFNTKKLGLHCVSLKMRLLSQMSRIYTSLLRHMSALTPLCIKPRHVLSAISSATLKDLITTSSFHTGGQVVEQINELTTWEHYEPCREVRRVSNTCCWATTTPGTLCICPGLPWSIYSLASEYCHGKKTKKKKNCEY